MTTKEIRQFVVIGRPLDWCYVTQPFGVNWADFYTKLGLKGHSGIDCRADRGTPVYATFEGEVTVAGDVSGYGITIFLETTPLGASKLTLEAVYGHLERVVVSKGDYVVAGQLVGYTDNTGVYTTGDHLHFGIRPKINGKWTENGYRGWIDPSDLFADKGWDLLPVQKRYMRFYREDDPKWRPWHAYQSEIKVVATFVRRIGRLPSWNMVNACTYGGWDYESVMNEAMFPVWATQIKSDYQKKIKVPIRLTS